MGGDIIEEKMLKRMGIGKVIGYIDEGIKIGKVERIIEDGEELMNF